MKKLLSYILALLIILMPVLSLSEETTERIEFSAPFTVAGMKGQTADSIATDRTYGAVATVLLLVELSQTGDVPELLDYFSNIYSCKSFVVKESMDTVLILVACNKTTILSLYYNPETKKASYSVQKYSCSSFDEINTIATQKAENYTLYYENNAENLVTTMQKFMQ